MPLTAAIILAAAAYTSAQQKESSKKASGDAADLHDPEMLAGSVVLTKPVITPAFVDESKLSAIDLLPLEKTLTIMERPISTVSFYEISSSNDLEVILKKLQARVEAVLIANPWLGGWILRGKGFGSFDQTIRIWYDQTGKQRAPGIFQHLSFDEVPLGIDTPFIDYETILGKTNALVKSNPEIINRKNEPMFRITVILEPKHIGGNDEGNLSFTGFALLASMSHICGDGHTFYRIYNMILGAEPISALIPQREQQFERKAMELMGRQEANYISHITSDPAWPKFFRREDSFANDDGGSKLQGRVFVVNRHWVGNLKASRLMSGNWTDVCTSTLRSPMSDAFLFEMESAQNPIQSTNDIIVSWFWNVIGPDVGMMAVNLRERVDLVTKDHAGNYANPIPYTTDDYRSPELIRASLKLCRRAGAIDGNMTLLPKAHPGVTFSVITNWSSFRPSLVVSRLEPHANEAEVATRWNDDDKVKLIRHLPIVHPKQMMKVVPKRMSFLVIFSSGREDIGCVLVAPSRVMNEVDTCGIMKEVIAEF